MPSAVLRIPALYLGYEARPIRVRMLKHNPLERPDEPLQDLLARDLEEEGHRTGLRLFNDSLALLEWTLLPSANARLPNRQAAVKRNR